MIKKKLIENVVSLFVLQGANYILPLITLPYLVRVLGPDKYGFLAIAAALIQYLVTFTDYGFNLTATRKIAISRDTPKKVTEIFNTVMFIKIILVLISFCLMACIVFLIPKFRFEWQLFFISFLTVVGNAMFPVWLFQGMEKMRYISILNIIAKIITTISIFIFVKNESDYLLAAFIQSMGFIIAGALSLYVVRHYFGIRFLFTACRKDIISELKEGGQVFVATLSGIVYGQGTVLITGLTVGATAAGYYAIAQKIATAVVGLIQPVAQAIYPYLCTQYHDDIKNYVGVKKRILTFGALSGTIISILLFIYSDLIVKLVSGSDFHQLVTLINIYSIVVLVTMINVLLNPFVLSMEKFKEMQKLYATTAILFLVISIPATMQLGIYGMVMSIFIIEVYVLFNSLKITRVDFNAKNIRNN